MKKRILVILLLGFLFIFPSWVRSQPDKFFERLIGSVLQPGDLKILQLEMNPDPVREGEWVSFQAVVSNRSRHPGRVSPDWGMHNADCGTVLQGTKVARTPDVWHGGLTKDESRRLIL